MQYRVDGLVSSKNPVRHTSYFRTYDGHVQGGAGHGFEWAVGKKVEDVVKWCRSKEHLRVYTRINWGDTWRPVTNCIHDHVPVLQDGDHVCPDCGHALTSTFPMNALALDLSRIPVLRD